MSEPASVRKLLSTAEAGSRRGVLAMSLGFVSWIAGTIAIANVLGGIESYWAHLVLEYGWMVLFLPMLGWLSGRFFQANPLGFAFMSSAGGQLFYALYETARSGLDDWLPGWKDVALFVGAWVLGVAVTAFAGIAGLKSRDRAQAKADARAAERRAELEAFTSSPDVPPKDPPAA